MIAAQHDESKDVLDLGSVGMGGEERLVVSDGKQGPSGFKPVSGRSESGGCFLRYAVTSALDCWF